MTDLTDVARHFDEAALTLEGAEAEAFGSDLDDQAYAMATGWHVDRIAPLFDRLPQDSVILDLGCGAGRLSLPVAQALPNCSVLGIDASPQMIHWANTGRPSPNLSYLVNDGAHLPRLGRLDGFFSMLLFQHLLPTECVSYLAQLGEAMRPGAVGPFQYVEGREHGPLSHQAIFPDVWRWCRDAWLRIIDVDDDDSYSPDWRWVTVVVP